MTSVEFSFITPTGDPLVDTDFEVQLSRSDFYGKQLGVVMPRIIMGKTDATGKAVLDLIPTDTLYHVTAFDPVSEANLHYDFLVPVLEIPGVVRLQDLIVKGKMSSKKYDEVALAVIQDAKANALLAQQSAKISETNAKASENVAVDSAGVAVAAADSVRGENALAVAARAGAEAARDAARVAQVVAEDRAADADLDAAAAFASKNSASASATSAATSEANALASKNAAAGSATAAADSATTATTKADNATQSATAASGSAASALEYATTATTKAGEASGSATTAGTKAGEASTSATTASTKAGEASASATTASTKATEAATSATNAKTSETNSKTSETNAKTSETNAATSKTGADTAKTAAETAKTASETAKTASETARDLAQQWATQTAAEVVAGQGYGAKKYADQAAASLTSMGKDSSNGVPGLTGFWLNLFNAAGTIKSMIASAATAARTWTFPDKDGTVALMSDVADPVVNTLNGGPLSAERNVLINGCLDVWQRGPGTFTFPTHKLSADMWSFSSSLGAGTAGGINALQGVFAAGQTDVPGNPNYFMRCNVTATTEVDSYMRMALKVESATTLSGQKAVLTFWAKADAAKYMAAEIEQIFGPGSTSAPTVGIGSTRLDLTTAWKKFSIPVTMPSVAGKDKAESGTVQVSLWFDGGTNWNPRTGSLPHQSGVFDIAMVRLEPGTVGTPYPRRPIAQEIALCQRYYEAVENGSVYNGAITAGVEQRLIIPFKVTKRIVPAMTLTNLASTNFPATPNVPSATVNGFVESRIADVTGGGGWRSSWTAAADL